MNLANLINVLKVYERSPRLAKAFLRSDMELTKFQNKTSKYLNI